MTLHAKWLYKIYISSEAGLKNVHAMQIFLFISVTVIYQLTNFFSFPAHDFGQEGLG